MYNNPYYNQNRFQPMGMPTAQINTNPYIQPMTQPITPTSNIGLQGKSVESLDVVRAMDIPLDGSISYFPLTDGSAIVSKQLQSDGTSKLTVYRPVEEDKKENQKYITMDELNEFMSDFDFSDIQDLLDIKDEIKDLKKQLKDIKKNKED